MALIDAVRLYEKGLTVFEGNDKVALEKHIIKTLCTEILSELIKLVSEEQVIKDSVSQILDHFYVF